MEKAKKIRLLTEKDVELRVKQTWENKNGVFALLLVYKEARTDMNILDETFGPMNWKRNHKLVGNTMYCSISVWDEDKHQLVENYIMLPRLSLSLTKANMRKMVIK